jgi:hypothetical protein
LNVDASALELEIFLKSQVDVTRRHWDAQEEKQQQNKGREIFKNQHVV